MQNKSKAYDLSVYVLIAILIALGWIVFSHTPHKILSWDIFGYYLYLPFTFIYDDLGLRNFDVVRGIIDKYQNTMWFYQALPQADGVWVMKYPMGMAVLYSPWFFAGHLWAHLSGAETDGFSTPYQLSLLYGSLVYTLLGVYFFRKNLRWFFDDKITSILLVLIVFGTNFLVLTVYHGQGLMSHNYLFFLFSLLLWFTLQWHKKASWYNSIALGFLIGIAALSRPTEILVAIVPLFWGVYNKESLNNKLALLRKNLPKVIVIILLVGVFGSMQLLYFKLMTGKFLFNSYGGNAGEGMEFLHPYILQVLFSFRKGWLVYTPVMAFALIGFYQLIRSNKKIFVSIFVFFISSFYVIASWSCWWYADSFSQRAVIPMYVFLALPLGYLIKYLFEKTPIIKSAFAVVLILLLSLNLFQSWQFLKGIIHSSRMTRSYYEAVFLKKHIPEGATKLLLVDRNKSPEQLLSESSFSSKLIVHQDLAADPQAEMAPDSTSAFKVKRESPFTPAIDIPWHQFGITEFGILKINAQVFCETSPGANPFLLTATFKHKGFPYYFISKTINSDKLPLLQWVPVEMYYLIPEVRRPDDVFRFTIHLRGQKPVWVREVKIELAQPQQ